MRKTKNHKNVGAREHFFILLVGCIFVFGVNAPAQTVQNTAVAGDQTQAAASDTNAGATGPAVSAPSGTEQGNSFLKVLAAQTAAQAQTNDETSPSERLAKALLNATMQTNVFAKEVGNSIAGYVREKQNEKDRQDLVDRFYYSCRQLMLPLRLTPQDYEELMRRVEWIYIEDGEKETHQLDTRTFRDLPNVIKKEYADMTLRRVQNGEVRTYYPSGSVKTVWNMQGGKPDGSVITYYENGEILYIDIYRNGQKTVRRKYDPEGRLEFEQPYSYVPEEPASSVKADSVIPSPHGVDSSAPVKDDSAKDKGASDVSSAKESAAVHQ